MLSSPVFLKQTHVSNLLYIHVIYGYDTKSAVFVATPAKYSIINKNYKMNTIILHFNKSPQNIPPPLLIRYDIEQNLQNLDWNT